MKSLNFLICLIIPFTTYGIGLDDFRERPFGHILFIRHALAPGSGTRIIFSSADATPKETWMNRDETRQESLESY